MQQNVRTMLKNIALKYELDMLILFGSASKKLIHKESDVDLAYLRKEKLSLKRELQLIKELSKFFNKQIDLVNIAGASPLLLRELAVNGQLLHGNKSDFNDFRILAMKHFLDFGPYFRLREQILNKNFS